MDRPRQIPSEQNNENASREKRRQTAQAERKRRWRGLLDDCGARGPKKDTAATCASAMGAQHAPRCIATARGAGTQASFISPSSLALLLPCPVLSTDTFCTPPSASTV